MVSLAVVPLSTVVTLFLPAGLAFYFVITSLLHLGQTWLTHQSWFRRRVGLKPLATASTHPGQMAWEAPRIIDVSAPRVTPVQRAPVVKAETVFGSIKSTVQDVKEKLSVREDKHSAERAQKAAREYDERRALEEKEKTIARREQKRARNGRY